MKPQAKNIGDLARLGGPDWHRIGKKSKNKGNRFEIKVAKILDAWFYASDLERLGTTKILRRTPLSGGWCKTGDVQVDPQYFKDVPEFPFHTEMKKREKWTLDGILLYDQFPVTTDWWPKAHDETPPGKITLLVFARNLLDPLCMFPFDAVPQAKTSLSRYLVSNDGLCITALGEFTNIDPEPLRHV